MNLINSYIINNINSMDTVKSDSRIGNSNHKTPNIDKPASNLIERYLQNLSNINSLNIQQNNEIITPSAIEGCNNYIETDNSGNKLIEVSNKKDGEFIIQNVKTKSIDGIVTERIVKNSANTRLLHLSINDKNGNILLNREKSYKKIDNDKAQTIVNGEIYNISGLEHNILTIEHNGKTVVLNLDKMLSADVVEDKSDNGDIIRSSKISAEEKEKLFSKIKVLDGDDLFRLSESVNTLQYFAGMDSFFEEKNKSLQLQTKDIFGQGITVHELGHAFNHKNRVRISDNEEFAKIRTKANARYSTRNNTTTNDKRFYGKFLDTQHCMQFYNGNETLANLNLQDEIFAESYNLLNSTKLVDFIDEPGCPGRMLSMMKYMPESLIEVNKQL